MEPDKRGLQDAVVSILGIISLIHPMTNDYARPPSWLLQAATRQDFSPGSLPRLQPLDKTLNGCNQMLGCCRLLPG